MIKAKDKECAKSGKLSKKPLNLIQIESLLDKPETLKESQIVKRAKDKAEMDYTKAGHFHFFILK
jgi:hypothetical protein